jgi:hypothetical protein
MDLITIENQTFGKAFTSWTSTFKIKIIKTGDDIVDSTVQFNMQ